MTDMLNYFISKLAQANYKIATHPESANIRLTSEVDIILLISPTIIPDQYKKDFEELIQLLGRSYGDAEHSGKVLHPHKIHGIRNVTAARYIKLLIDIQETLEATREARENQ